MAALDNPRWEIYCQKRAQGICQVDSYIAAKFDVTNEHSAGACASRLESDPAIRERIKELQARMVKRGQLTRLGIIDMLLEDRESARDANQISAAIRAAELMGKEIGMFTERRDAKPGIFDERDYAEVERIRDWAIAESARVLAGTGNDRARSESVSGNEQDQEILSGDRPASA